MLTMSTTVALRGVKGKAISDFMLNCTDEQYRNWWKGTHFAFHTIKRFADNIGNTVVFDEIVGNRRLKFTAIVTEAIPGRKLVWQLTKRVKLPGWLIMEFEETQDGVVIRHILKAGYQGIGRLIDPVIKLYLSDDFEKALKEHAQTEFSKLAELLS